MGIVKNTSYILSERTVVGYESPSEELVLAIPINAKIFFLNYQVINNSSNRISIVLF